MKISEAEGKKGLRVRLIEKLRDRQRGSLIQRTGGALTSGRILRQLPGHEEGLFVRVRWDGMPSPENWHLEDLELEP